MPSDWQEMTAAKAGRAWSRSLLLATNPTWAGVAAAAILFIGALFFQVFFLAAARRSIQEEVRNDIAHLAAIAASQVDPTMHETLRTREQEESADYIASLEPLARLQEANEDIAYVYTCRMVGGRVIFVLDPTPVGDSDGDGIDDKSHLMQPYDDASPTLVRVLETGLAATDEEPYTDSWGTFVSGYAPIRGRDGKLVAVAGVDLRATEYLGHLDAVEDAFRAGVLVALAVAISIGWGARRLLLHLEGVRRSEQAALSRAETARLAAEAANRSKSDFLAMASHEIRTPTNRILRLAHLLAAKPIDGEVRELVATLVATARDQIEILDGLIDYSKIEAGQLALEDAVFSPFAVVDGCVSLLGAKAQEKELTVHTSLDLAVPAQLRGDPHRIKQILSNLLSNALKCTIVGQIQVRLESKGEGRYRFEVEDTGVGFSAGAQEMLFRPDAQATRPTAREFGGTGLGLAVGNRLVGLMGGEMGLRSEPGKGSLFWFEIPLQTADGGPGNSESGDTAHASGATCPAQADLCRTPVPPHRSQPVGPPSASPASGDSRILLAEDNPVNQKVALRLLALIGHSAVLVENGEQAVRAILEAEPPFDLVLMDCQMPVLDGYEAARQVRARERGRRTPIVAMTANALQGDRELCLEAGMDDYLMKPVVLEALRALVARWSGCAGAFGGEAGETSEEEMHGTRV